MALTRLSVLAVPGLPYGFDTTPPIPPFIVSKKFKVYKERNLRRRFENNKIVKFEIKER